MPEFHIHVYATKRMQQYEVEAPTSQEARCKALDLFDKEPENILPLSDTKAIALTWDEKGIIRDMGDSNGRSA